MRWWPGSALAIALVALAAVPAPAQEPRPTAHSASLGPIHVEMRGHHPPRIEDFQGGQRVATWFDEVTVALMRGSPAVLAPRAPFRSSYGSLRETDAQVCGVPARRREAIEDPGDLTAWVEDDDGRGRHEEVTRYPMTVTVSMAFEWAGERWRLDWAVRDVARRGRHRAHERRFFASVRCDAAALPSTLP